MEPVKITLKNQQEIERKILDLELRVLINWENEKGQFNLYKHITQEELFFIQIAIRKIYLEYLTTVLGDEIVQKLRKSSAFDEYFRQCLSTVDRTTIADYPLESILRKTTYIELTSQVMEYFVPNRVILNQLKTPTHDSIAEPA